MRNINYSISCVYYAWNTSLIHPTILSKYRVTNEKLQLFHFLSILLLTFKSHPCKNSWQILSNLREKYIILYPVYNTHQFQLLYIQWFFENTEKLMENCKLFYFVCIRCLKYNRSLSHPQFLPNTVKSREKYKLFYILCIMRMK